MCVWERCLTFNIPGQTSQSEGGNTLISSPLKTRHVCLGSLGGEGKIMRVYDDVDEINDDDDCTVTLL